jgi:ATP-dependent DNA ligase
MSYNDWINKNSTLTCQQSREKLEDMNLEVHSKYLKVVHRDIVPPSKIIAMHDIYVKDGYEGVMIKSLDTKYKFGRGHNVMKYKSFVDVDLEVVSFEEGIGKYEGMLGAIVVKNNKWKKFLDGVLVNVGSGFDDDARKIVWDNRSKFRGMIAEVRYQFCKNAGHGPNGETPDGSLLFPTFRGWRPDKQ